MASGAKQTNHKFDLDGALQLQVKVVAGFPVRVEFEVRNATSSFLLHWGSLHHAAQKNWLIPSHWPTGTQNYKGRALQTPFTKSGGSSFLTIEVRDPKICSIEFLLKDTARDKWRNFHIDIPRDDANIPEDLVQVKAYLQWESKGKKMYTPEQEKV
eukprot:Gb_00438 [translate_table: standard]